MSGILDYQEGHSIFHKANPITKVLFAACMCLATFLAQSYAALVALLALIVVVGLLCGLQKKVLSLLTAFATLGVFMCLVQTLIVRDGSPLVLWITDKGLDTGLHVALRLVSFALPLVIMLNLTRLSDLANAAVEVLHVPYRYAFTITTALRFVPLFSYEMNHIIEAQTARGVEFDTPNPFKRLKLTLPLIAPLLILSVARADDIALAAEQRGFYLRGCSSSYKHYPMGIYDAAIALLSLLCVLVGILW